MSVFGIGDGAQQFNFARNTADLKTTLSQLTNSLSTGKVADLTEALGGDTKRYTDLSYDLTQANAYAQTIGEVSLLFAKTQVAVSQLETFRASAADVFLAVGDLSGADQIDRAAQSGGEVFDGIVGVLNTRAGDRNLFAGTVTAGPTTITAQQMLDAITAALPAAPTVDDIVQTVASYFDPLSGDFVSNGYFGSASPAQGLRIADNTQITAPAAANDERFLSVLAAGAIAALSGERPNLTTAEKGELLSFAGLRMQAAASDLTDVAADLGRGEEMMEKVQVQLEAKRTIFGMAQNDLAQADPFKTATRLQAVQLQLETHFSAMARLSQLSLLRFI